MLNEDYRDMLRALSDENTKFLLVGAYALAVREIAAIRSSAGKYVG